MFKFDMISRHVAFLEWRAFKKGNELRSNEFDANFNLGFFLDTLEARSFQLCLRITFKRDIYMRVLMTLVKFHGHSNFGNILNGKHTLFPQ